MTPGSNKIVKNDDIRKVAFDLGVTINPNDKAPDLINKIREVRTDKDVVDAINDQHSKLFDSIVELNREQAMSGVPMYALNPAENLLHRLESGFQTMAGTVGARDALADFARLRSTSRYALVKTLLVRLLIPLLLVGLQAEACHRHRRFHRAVLR